MSDEQRGIAKLCLIMLVLLLVVVSRADTQDSDGAVPVGIDGKIGTFQQHNSGDCFFLVSVLALINDSDGRLMVENSFTEVPGLEAVKIIFPTIRICR